MQTYSHILIAASLSQPVAHWLSSKELAVPKMKFSAIIFGSLLPDLALIILTIVCLIRDKIVGVFSSDAWENYDHNLPASLELLNISWTTSLFEDWFFNDPFIITLQNTFHSLFLLTLFILTSYFLWKRTFLYEALCSQNRRFYQWIFWMFCAAMLHTMVDIPSHANDGPLIAFPLNWDYRFISPISYWDSNYHGRTLSIFEHAIDALIIIYLLRTFFVRKRQPKVE